MPHPIRRLAALLIAAIMLPASALAAGSGKVNVYNWNDYIDPALLEEFTKETGIEVVYDTYDSNEVLEAKLLTGNTGYDVVVPTGDFLARQIAAGAYQKLDKGRLQNLKHMDPGIMERLAGYDPGNAHGVNYMWGTTGIGFNPAKVAAALPGAPLDSWSLIFDPKNAKALASCGIVMLDAPDEVIPAVLAWLGEDPNSHDPKVVAKAEAALLAIRPFVRTFHSSQYIEDLARGEVCVALGWNGDVGQATARAAEAGKGVEVKYFVPKEGARIWVDAMAIPKDAPNPVNAHKFIDFFMRPDVAARSSNFITYATGNKAAVPLLDPAIRENRAIYPDAATMARLFVAPALDAQTQRLFTRTWQRVKSMS